MTAFIRSDKDRKRELVRRYVTELKRRSPAMLAEMARAIEDMSKHEFHPSSGRLRGEKDHGYVKVRVPRELFLGLRILWRRANPYPAPQFGDDEQDLQIIAEEFPKLCSHRAKNNRAPTTQVVNKTDDPSAS